jgi:thymidylate synthase
MFKMFGFDQWEHLKKLLRADVNSRQAVIHIKDASNEPTKDTPCTVALQYSIREGKLYATTYMRSNDIWRGFPYDVFAFTCFQVKLAMELGVDVGTYTHIAGSLHLYERDANHGADENTSKS